MCFQLLLVLSLSLSLSLSAGDPQHNSPDIFSCTLTLQISAAQCNSTVKVSQVCARSVLPLTPCTRPRFRHNICFRPHVEYLPSVGAHSRVISRKLTHVFTFLTQCSVVLCSTNTSLTFCVFLCLPLALSSAETDCWSQKHRLCTYSVTLWRVRVTIVAMETQQLVAFALFSSSIMFCTAVKNNEHCLLLILSVYL
jgi:hypothetical protein